LKIVDFGLAELFSLDKLASYSMQKSTIAQQKGTERYMAPEMISLKNLTEE